MYSCVDIPTGSNKNFCAFTLASSLKKGKKLIPHETKYIFTFFFHLHSPFLKYSQYHTMRKQ